MKNLKIIFLTILSLLALSCQEGDVMSEIGQSVQPDKDNVTGTEFNLKFESETVKFDSVYSKNTLGLLGSIYDNSFGEFDAETLVQLRTAYGFKLNPSPVNDKIDSTKIRITFSEYIGSNELPINFDVYSLLGNIEREKYSKQDLQEYKSKAKKIGSLVAKPSVHFKVLKETNQQRVYALDIKLDDNLGQRIYNLSKTNPEYFDSQKAFNENVLGGLIVSPSTGRGYIIQTMGIALESYYQSAAKTKEGKDTTILRKMIFVNTEATAQVNAISNTYADDLLKANKEHTFVSSPAGVVTKISLSKSELSKLLKGESKMNIGRDWTINAAMTSIKAELPDKVILNPPSNLLLIQKDSIDSFFSKELPVLGFNAVAFVSSKYDIAYRRYVFRNISGLITNFLRKEANYNDDTKTWTINKDLDMYMLPVRTTGIGENQNGGLSVAISQYIFPSIVRLSKKPEDTSLTLVVSKF